MLTALLNRTSKSTKNRLLLRLKRNAGLNDDGSMSPSSFASPELCEDFNPSQESLDIALRGQVGLGDPGSDPVDPDEDQDVKDIINSNMPASPDHQSAQQLHRLSDSPQIEMRFSNVSLSKQFPVDMLAQSAYHSEDSDTSVEENHTEQAQQGAGTQGQPSVAGKRRKVVATPEDPTNKSSSGTHRKHDLAPIQIPRPSQRNHALPALSQSDISGHMVYPTKGSDSPVSANSCLSSMESGTSIARALFANSFVLSSDARNSGTRHRDGTRQDSATLPRDWRDRRFSGRDAVTSGDADAVPPVPPIPARLDALSTSTMSFSPMSQPSELHDRQSIDFDGEPIIEIIAPHSGDADLRTLDIHITKEASALLPPRSSSLRIIRRTSRKKKSQTPSTTPSASGTDGGKEAVDSNVTPSPKAGTSANADNSSEGVTLDLPPRSNDVASTPRTGGSEGDIDSVLKDYQLVSPMPKSRSFRLSGRKSLLTSPRSSRQERELVDSSSRVVLRSPRRSLFGSMSRVTTGRNSRTLPIGRGDTKPSASSSNQDSVLSPVEEKVHTVPRLSLTPPPPPSLQLDPATSSSSSSSNNESSSSTSLTSNGDIPEPPHSSDSDPLSRNSSIFGRHRSGSIPNPITIVRDSKDPSAFKITVTPENELEIGGSPFPSGGRQQTFPETPNAFSPLFSALLASSTPLHQIGGGTTSIEATNALEIPQSMPSKDVETSVESTSVMETGLENVRRPSIEGDGVDHSRTQSPSPVSLSPEFRGQIPHEETMPETPNFDFSSPMTASSFIQTPALAQAPPPFDSSSPSLSPHLAASTPQMTDSGPVPLSFLQEPPSYDSVIGQPVSRADPRDAIVRPSQSPASQASSSYMPPRAQGRSDTPSSSYHVAGPLSRVRNRLPVPMGPRGPSRPGDFSANHNWKGQASPAARTPSPGGSSGQGSIPRKIPTSSPKFQVPPLKWRGWKIDVARWNLTSEQLHDVVSRSIKRCAERSFIRLLSPEQLDKDVPQEEELLQASSTDIKGRYRLAVRKRWALLSALFAQMDGSDLHDEAATDLLSNLVDIISEQDLLVESLYCTEAHLSQLRSLREVHSASALAVALHKLNHSFLKQAGEVQRLREKVESLEAERDEAWGEAEQIALEFDDLNDKVVDAGLETYSRNPSRPASRRSSLVMAVRKSSLRMSKSGLRRSSSRSLRLSASSGSLPSAPIGNEDVPPVPPVPKIQLAPLNLEQPDPVPPLSSTSDALMQEVYEMLGTSLSKASTRPRSRSLSGKPSDSLPRTHHSRSFSENTRHTSSSGLSPLF